MAVDDKNDSGKVMPLPKGWAWATLGSLCAPERNAITDGPFGSKLKTAHYTRSGPRVFGSKISARIFSKMLELQANLVEGMELSTKVGRMCAMHLYG